MVKMLLGASKRVPTLGQRAFSSQVAPVSQAAAAAAQGNVMTLWEYSAKTMQKAADKDQSEEAYLDTLKQYSTVPGAYKPLSETGSSEHLKQIRKRINRVVEQEIGLVEFKDQVKGEELAQSAYEEVITKENFFYKVDEQKKARNL